MIFITQIIYILEGQESVFDQFEAIALPSIPKYNGRLLFRLRPGSDAFLECTIDTPYEVHLVQFQSDSDLNAYMQDEDRKKFLHLKERSIRSTIMIKGSRV